MNDPCASRQSANVFQCNEAFIAGSFRGFRCRDVVQELLYEEHVPPVSREMAATKRKSKNPALVCRAPGAICLARAFGDPRPLTVR